MSEEEKEINLTYETLFELLRREKNRVEIQPLEASFYKDFLDYFKTKKELLQERQGKLSPDQGEDLTKLMIQIDNIKKIMKELYERREKKIVNLALLAARSNSRTRKEELLEFEENLYNNLISLFSGFRNGILLNLLNQNSPVLPELYLPSQANPENNSGQAEDDSKEKKEEILIRFLSSVPQFVGEELETYGPFNGEEITTLPTKIADILINRGKAEEIQED